MIKNSGSTIINMRYNIDRLIRTVYQRSTIFPFTYCWFRRFVFDWFAWNLIAFWGHACPELPRRGKLRINLSLLSYKKILWRRQTGGSLQGDLRPRNRLQIRATISSDFLRCLWIIIQARVFTQSNCTVRSLLLPFHCQLLTFFMLYIRLCSTIFIFVKLISNTLNLAENLHSCFSKL